MAGLLNFDDPQSAALLQLGLGLLSAGGPQSRPVSLGQAFGEAGNGALNAYRQTKEANYKDQLNAFQLDEMKRKLKMRDLMGKALMGESQSAQTQPYGGGYSPDVSKAFGVPQGQPQAQARPVSYSARLMEAARQSGDVEAFMEAQKMALEEKKLGPKFKADNGFAINPATGKLEMWVTSDQTGKPEFVGVAPKPDMTEIDQGGYRTFVDKNAVMPGQQFKKTMSPDAVASNNLGWFNATKPTFNQEAGGFVVGPSKANPTGGVIPVDGVKQKMTEDQSKATGWLIQAENSFANMKKAMDANPDSAKPGFNDALASIPSFGLTTGLANTFRSAPRQQFIQASSSLSEALLRAATGAGVNESEAKQKIQELTPVFGESSETTKQKMDSIPLYIESLKARAGPGAAIASKVISENKVDPIQAAINELKRRGKK